jgi:hypothetical protein
MHSLTDNHIYIIGRYGNFFQNGMVKIGYTSLSTASYSESMRDDICQMDHTGFFWAWCSAG